MRIFLVALAIFFTSACSYQAVDAGEEGVLTYQPWFFGAGGVDSDPVETGAVWTVWSTSIDRYNIKPVKYRESFVDLTASDNVAIDFDFYTTIAINEGGSPKIHELSGKEWYNNKVKDTLRAYVRNEARTRSSIGLRTDERVILEVQEVILNKLKDYVISIDLPITISKVNIGKVVPPNEVLAEAAQTAAQKQRVKTQTQRELAERSRAAAETAKALADKAYSSEFKMSTEQFLKNKQLDILSEAVDKNKDVSFIVNASEANPFFSTK